MAIAKLLSSKWGQNSHMMTLAQSSRSSSQSPALRCSIAGSGGRLESGGWTHGEKLTFQSQLCSVLRKVLNVCIFSRSPSSLQHCEMKASITIVLISK